MHRKLLSPLKHTAIFSLALVFALSITWATDYHRSIVIEKGKGGALNLVHDGADRIGIWLTKGALDAYMTEQGLNEVEITIDLEEELESKEDGSTYYRLEFEFGPSGAYLDPPLQLHLKGKYVADDTEVWLYDEQGEALQAIRNTGAHAITFYIPHFSEYSYDDYY